MTNQESKSEEVIEVIHDAVEFLYEQLVKLLMDCKVKPGTLTKYTLGMKIINECWWTEESILREDINQPIKRDFTNATSIPASDVDGSSSRTDSALLAKLIEERNQRKKADIDNVISYMVDTALLTKSLEEKTHRIAYLEKLIVESGIIVDQ
jgi:hypothetical protein